MFAVARKGLQNRLGINATALICQQITTQKFCMSASQQSICLFKCYAASCGLQQCAFHLSFSDASYVIGQRLLSSNFDVKRTRT